MSPADLPSHPAQIFFNNLTLEFGAERPLFFYDKILSGAPQVGGVPRSCWTRNWMVFYRRFLSKIPLNKIT